jgi:hypothetical protein
LQWFLDESTPSFRAERNFEVRKEFPAWLGFALWLGSSAIGFGVWHDTDTTPGTASPTIDSKPTASPAGHPRLVVYLHPRCPCSRATLEEFASVLGERSSDVEVGIVFVRPPGADDGWERGELWNLASRFPGVHVRVDAEGLEAEAAGATTSGYVVYTDGSGRILFQGGITRGRGLYGDNSGRRALVARLHGSDSSDREPPVFGCPLFAPDRCPKAGR